MHRATEGGFTCEKRCILIGAQGTRDAAAGRPSPECAQEPRHHQRGARKGPNGQGQAGLKRAARGNQSR